MKLALFSWLLLMAICSLFHTISVFGASASCLGNEQSLLLQLKNNLTFDPSWSTKLVKWNQSADCCSWVGVTCNEGRVIGLDLTNESITGRLNNSSSLFSLEHLQSLSLAYNGFDDFHEIPSEFDKLVNLSYLNLSYSRFTGQIPIAISHLTRLVTLDLSFNDLHLENPNLKVLIQNLSDLMELHLDRVLISAPGNEWCLALSSSLPNLRVLSLSYCNLSGPIDSSLQNLQSLSIIRLNYNYFSAPVLEFFADFKNLTSLEVVYSGLNGKFPKKIFQIPTLRTLDLSNNFLLEGSLPEFPPNGSLQTMVLGGTSFSGALPSSIGNLKMLSTINLLRCNFVGSIPDSLFSLPSLQILDLSDNQFSGQLKEFSNTSSYLLEELHLDNNHLEGPIPMSIFELRGLRELSLSSNKFNNSMDLSVIQHFKNLSILDLSYNNLLIEYTGFNLSLFSISLTNLTLASCKLNKFPDFLRNQSNLYYLDLSHNQIYGEIPNWIWKLPNLTSLDLSYNFLVTLEGPILNVSLGSLNLRSNQLQGQLPIISYVKHLDFSENSLHSSITAISQSLPIMRFLFLSSNQFYGGIPISICNATYLELLDLSNNSMSGTIPQCLIKMTGTLGVLNLRTNNFNGTIPDAFPDNCGLQTLSLNKNQLEGRLPKSLANCSRLDVLDIGNNHIEATFPFFLKNTTRLRVLVLRSNKFYGPIAHPELNATWPMLQIVDVASNNFTGNLPITLFSSSMAMKDHENGTYLGLTYLQFYMINGFYYQDTVTVISKGSEIELEKILTIFTTLDFSCNNFDGPIPEEIGELTLLYILNLSHNAFTDQIPSSLAKLSHLESLDLSNNELTGKIPEQLANGLIFLSVLNLSFNQLVGQIPLIKQFLTFPEASFKGNKRLCGFPLKSKCTYEDPQLPPPIYEEIHRSMIEWNYICVEVGFVFGFGIVIGPLMFRKKWRIWYYKHVEDILFKIVPQLCLRKEHHRRQAFRNQESRR